MVWNLADHITSLGTPGAGPSGGSGGAGGATLQAQLRLAGHENTVEDVTFLPGSAEQLASVGERSTAQRVRPRGGAGPCRAAWGVWARQPVMGGCIGAAGAATGAWLWAATAAVAEGCAPHTHAHLLQVPCLNTPPAAPRCAVCRRRLRSPTLGHAQRDGAHAADCGRARRARRALRGLERASPRLLCDRCLLIYLLILFCWGAWW